MVKALIPGSFDPITTGHVDLIERASKLVDYLYVAVMVNPDKQYTFNTEQRMDFIRQSLAHLTNVEIVSSEGLTVDLCRDLNCRIIIKGVRTNQDYEYELNLANVNLLLNDEIESLLLFAKPTYSGISSSLLKQLVRLDANVDLFLPSAIRLDVLAKLSSMK